MISFPLDSLLAGIPQKVKFTVTTGHYTIKNGDSLQLSNAEAMLILCQAESRAMVYSNTRGEVPTTQARGGRPPCPALCGCEGEPGLAAVLLSAPQQCLESVFHRSTIAWCLCWGPI